MRFPGVVLLGVLASVGVSCGRAQQQRPMGTLPTTDALVNGQVAVSGNEAALISNVSMKVYDHAAPVTLGRGGELLVCSTSEFHLLRSNPGESLVFGLDRGALELRSATQTGDMVLTPDLKLTPVTKGEYDLRLRVTREGDTCVENAGANAPVLNVTDAFSSQSYRVLPGQHLLFVKGDLKSVVDHERSPCGCPATQMAASKPGQSMTAAQAHPFPEAQSEGLAPTAMPGNEAASGTATAQVTSTFSYGDGHDGPVGVPAMPAGQAPAPQPQPHGFFHSIGRFFHRLFHPGDGEKAQPGTAANQASRGF